MDASDASTVRLFTALTMGAALHAGFVLIAAKRALVEHAHHAPGAALAFVDLTPESTPPEAPSNAVERTDHAVQTRRAPAPRTVSQRTKAYAVAPSTTPFAGSDGVPGTGLAASKGNGGDGSARVHGATLVAALPCNGFFPYRAHDDAATVNVAVTVDPSGAPGTVRVERESPAGEGFGQAAESCVRFARFLPATDVAGGRVASIAHLELTFRRHRR